jgi:predicted transcriptional regulator
VEAVEQGNTMTPTQFRAWKRRMGFSLADAGVALGRSRRMIEFYQKGRYAVPYSIAKLCRYIERDQKNPNPTEWEPQP